MINYICIGHAKCGTTLLDEVFRNSQLVATPKAGKELKFFLPASFGLSGAYERYMQKLAARRTPFAATFEASPQYSQQNPDDLERVLQNIDELLPDSRIIICFRHPVLRAYSHYLHDIHKFALYGDLVFSRRPVLMRRPFSTTFSEALPRLARSYSTTLQKVISRVGRERVILFFLERDAARLPEWIMYNFGSVIAKDVEPIARNIGAVFARRPLPNYVADGSSLHAFGSSSGEYVKYEGLTGEEITRILETPKRWTLKLEPDEAQQLYRRYFQEDIERCMQLGCDDAFREYDECLLSPEYAELSDASLLSELHGVSLPQPGANESGRGREYK